MTRRLPSLNGVKAFEAAARSESFTRAAEELNVTQAEIENLGAKYDYQTQNAALQYSAGLLR